MWDTLLYMLLGGLGGAAAYGVYKLAKLTFEAIQDWLGDAVEEHPDATTCVLIKEKLDSGKFNVVAGIFDENDTELDKRQWETDELSPDLKQAFGNSNEIVYDLTN